MLLICSSLRVNRKYAQRVWLRTLSTDFDAQKVQHIVFTLDGLLNSCQVGKLMISCSNLCLVRRVPYWMMWILMEDMISLQNQKCSKRFTARSMWKLVFIRLWVNRFKFHGKAWYRFQRTDPVKLGIGSIVNEERLIHLTDEKFCKYRAEIWSLIESRKQLVKIVIQIHGPRLWVVMYLSVLEISLQIMRVLKSGSQQ